MQVAVRTIRVVRTEATEKEWDALRQLVAEGLTVVETITPAMAHVAESLGLQVRDNPAPAPESAPAPKRRRTKAASPAEEG
ncbi:hypothetical protein [Sulfobacillus harzensis]|uniref:Uncharacterized protein n=1 Tax=Sulfobacillus harzensis TaxID=2729629 RepID=A0A7Y0L0G4_9FIRM|nr:hypothetical protein [Sulfobacillus harzensis]NMP20758.1 hypothetical protein [Sulfobacillus harzensis]